jgi:hypothetical protein
VTGTGDSPPLFGPTAGKLSLEDSLIVFLSLLLALARGVLGVVGSPLASRLRSEDLGTGERDCCRYIKLLSHQNTHNHKLTVEPAGLLITVFGSWVALLLVEILLPALPCFCNRLASC